MEDTEVNGPEKKRSPQKDRRKAECKGDKRENPGVDQDIESSSGSKNSPEVPLHSTVRSAPLQGYEL